MDKQIKIALAGNPNCGKTTLFNALTGSNQFVGNWPGVTVEKKEGKLKKHDDVVIMDLPGIYSLSPYTLEEVVARNYLIGQRPDAILNIIDGTNLERNLYLTTQLTELGIPVVIAINMMDVVRKNGDQINVAELSRELGCEIVEISALKGDGVMQAAEAAVSGAAVQLDVGRFGDAYFSYVAAFGAFTDVPYATPQGSKNALGKLAYLLEGAQRLPSLRPYPVRVEHDGGVIEDDILVGLVSNSSSVAGFPVGRLMDVSMSDGLLEVTLVRNPPSILELTRIINHLLVSQLDPDMIYSFKTTKLRITCDTPIPWTLDGEYGGDHLQADICNVPHALRINVPVEQVLPQPGRKK